MNVSEATNNVGLARIAQEVKLSVESYFAPLVAAVGYVTRDTNPQPPAAPEPEVCSDDEAHYERDHKDAA